MNRSKDQFFVSSPNKIFIQAEQYSRTLDHHHEMPKQMSKSIHVKTKAQLYKEDIQYAIKMAEYQRQLFRSKESEDVEVREKMRRRFVQSQDKIVRNRGELGKKKVKKGEDYNKHIKEVFQRYSEEERQKRVREKEESSKLRDELKEFYSKQAERKTMNDRCQVKVGTCYQDAVQRINDIHRKNEEYSRKAELALKKELKRNNKFNERINLKRRIVSEANNKKPEVYGQSFEILNSKTQKFIQTCGKNEDGHLQAWQKMGKTVTDWRKKRGEENKKNLLRWKENKYRVQEAKAHVSDKCLSILDKTARAEFRKTSSTFRQSANRFQDIVKQNKRDIWQCDEQKKDELLEMHLDLTLRNVSTAKMTQKMQSMRQHARKLAYDFL